jgi:acyl-coenzyme A synthetase/AMP-(fatty) acid ligase
MADPALSFRLACRAVDDELFRLEAETVTTATLLGMAGRLANELPPGEHVLNLCQDRLQFAVALTAAILRGQVSLLTGDRSPDRLRALAERFNQLYTISDDPGQTSPFRHHLVRLPGQWSSFHGQNNPEIRASQCVAVVFTSGSTGEPVAHRKTWGALAERSADAAARFGMTADRATSVVGTVPPYHMYGFETTVLLPLHAPASTWCGPTFYPEDVATALRSVPEPRVLVTTPLQIRAMLHTSVQFPSLDRIISATAPLSHDLAVAAEQRWDTEVFEIFGATEVGSIASRRTREGDTWTAYPRVRLGARIPDGEAAETVVSGPLSEPQGLSDVIEMLDPCHFRLLGRRADMIKLGGRRASLAELNHILMGIEGVLDGQFVAPEDLELRPTARLLAFVVAPERTADDILVALRGRIDPPFLPRRVIRVDELPRDDVGKLTDQALSALRARSGNA